MFKTKHFQARLRVQMTRKPHFESEIKHGMAMNESKQKCIDEEHGKLNFRVGCAM